MEELQKNEERSKEKDYWTEDTENAVKRYLNLDFEHLNAKLEKYIMERNQNYDPTIDDGVYAELELLIDMSVTPESKYKKEEIFRNHIRTPLNKLIENMIFTFKLFSHDVDVKTLHNECMTHVYMKFSNFDATQGTKSFSYFGTIAKHFLQNRKKNLDDTKSINLNYDDYNEELENRERVAEDFKPEADAGHDMFNFTLGFLESEQVKKNMSSNDAKVANAIAGLFRNHEMFESTNYSKQSLYNALKEYTKLDTKEITYSLGRLRKLYRWKKEDFIKKKANE